MRSRCDAVARVVTDLNCAEKVYGSVCNSQDPAIGGQRDSARKGELDVVCSGGGANGYGRDGPRGVREC